MSKEFVETHTVSGATPLLEAAVMEAIASDMPTIIDFWTDGCHACHVLGPIMDEFADAHRGVINVYKVDVEEATILREAVRIRFLPTIGFFVSGKDRGWHEGSCDLSELAALAKEHFWDFGL